MTYPKENLKIDCDKKKSVSFRLFQTENVSDAFYPMRTSLYVPFKHTLISLNSFVVVPVSMRIFYLLTESWAFSQSINNYCTDPSYSHFLLRHMTNTEYLISS
jgi:hypothetical protein